MRYTTYMSKDVNFQLDTTAAGEILTNMVAPLIKKSGEAIANRARNIAGAMTSDPPEITVTTSVGINKGGKGERAIATITSTGNDAHANYIGLKALVKAKDAGRV